MGIGHDHDVTGGAAGAHAPGGLAGAQTAATAHRRRLKIVLSIYVTIILAEAIGSWLTNSLALLAEALHMAVDASGILIALIATYLATRPATKRRSFGMMRAEIVAVLINCLLLFGLGGYILFEAVDRWFNPDEVAGGGVILFAVVGLIGSGISLTLLSRGSKESLNVKAAFLEVMSDGIGAAAIIISGILNLLYGWNQGDAIAAAAIGVIILPRAFMLLKQAINLIMQGVPNGIELAEVELEIEKTHGVASVHSLHVWGLTSGVSVMSAHIVPDPDATGGVTHARLLDSLTETMRERFGIEHCTFQLEEADHLLHEGSMHRDLAGMNEAPSVSGGQDVGHSH
ncbi:cation diffusion facilitator family transporter [Leucobacter luti]|uniref:Cobalt-zinc-cadmium efflux system protein n=1 Tax=Leucobacter luti TaxID=340320 RepID=A0A4Q7U0G0_9MICO|nr:cation diffusion facilitator family transporter [Leucobacter luti]MBL3698842.1 cation transporter [Leucobacter luti]RZT66220.1 cobalt-zinc-cadmium efflux system protein [Leucobacter luti]